MKPMNQKDIKPRVKDIKSAYTFFSIEDLTSKNMKEIKTIPNFTMKNVNEMRSFFEKNGFLPKE